MRPKLIVMLTHKDHTVENSLEVFESCKDLPVDFWGFKDVGLPSAKMRELADAMKKAGKTTFMEVVTYTEEDCLAGAKMSLDYGFDYLTGTLFFPAVWGLLKDNPIKYFPFFGDVGGSPVTMRGSLDDIVSQAKKLAQIGVHGLDLVAYRYVDGSPEELAKRVVAAVNAPVIIAGSIASEERLRIMKEINPFAFTMGSALFDKLFEPKGGFRENLERVIEIMDRL